MRNPYQVLCLIFLLFANMVIGMEVEFIKKVPLTETLTQELIQDESKGSYKDERALFQLLQKQGNSPIDQKVFLGAYFENYDPDLPYGERIPNWKKLYKAINEAYTPGFLVKLDDFVKVYGVEKAVEVMRYDWKEIVNISNNHSKSDSKT